MHSANSLSSESREIEVKWKNIAFKNDPSVATSSTFILSTSTVLDFKQELTYTLGISHHFIDVIQKNNSIVKDTEQIKNVKSPVFISINKDKKPSKEMCALRLMSVIDPTNSFVIECNQQSTVEDVKRMMARLLTIYAWSF